MIVVLKVTPHTGRGHISSDRRASGKLLRLTSFRCFYEQRFLALDTVGMLHRFDGCFHCFLVGLFVPEGGAIVLQDLYDSSPELAQVVVSCLLISLPVRIVVAPCIIKGDEDVSRALKLVGDGLYFF